ncbi:unnamed protein product [Musa textilis]
MLVALLLVSRCLGYGFGDEDHVEVERNSSRCMESERGALLAIKSDMYDPDNWFSTWTGKDCCGWRGVACDHTTGRVIKLDLHYPYTYHGAFETIGGSKVNPSLQELKHLKYLDLSMNNFFHAPVPKWIASLIHLEFLNLSYAMFDGRIPPHFGNLSNLHYLDFRGWYSYHRHIDDLDLLARIPSLKYLDMSFINLSKVTNWFSIINSISTLEVLNLTYAHLPCVQSPLPTFNLTAISTLDLSGNFNITSTMLTWLANATSLEYLLLSGCGNLTVESVQIALGALSNLKGLDLSDNSLEGTIIRMVSNVSSRDLKHLDLSENYLSGGIPQTLWSLRQLEYLDLSWNFKIAGHVAALLGNLTSLRHLGLGNNLISGEIPSTVGNFVQLQYQDLFNNSITGEIPSSIGNLTDLVYLDLSRNFIVGQMPPNLGDLTKLISLDLWSNNITGSIPETIGCLQSLRFLRLGFNAITEQIPKTIGRLHRLQVLDMSYNNLSGPIPMTMGGLCNLIVLFLSHNNIGGELTNLFDDLSTCSHGASLSFLFLGNNNLSGIIPTSMGQLSQLQILYISSNLLVGNITEAHFSNLTSLSELMITFNSLKVVLSNDWLPPFSAFVIHLSFCNIRAKFPNWIRTQQQLQGLYLSGVGIPGSLPVLVFRFLKRFAIPSAPRFMLDLSNNSFLGPIPLGFAEATNLTLLFLSHNHINEILPSSFCNMHSLQILDLSNNHLIGEVPYCQHSFPTSLQSLHLNNNNISRTIPFFLKHCKQLIALDFGENKLSGKIPTWIGRNLSSLKVLRLRSNLLYGTIPVNIVDLSSLQVLDLSSNNLFGSLPSSLGNFSAMAEKQNDTRSELHTFSIYYHESISVTTKGLNVDYTTILSLVTNMDLSNNHLSGEIPKELTKLLGLRFLNLSNNHLTGRIPENIGDMKLLESFDLSKNSLTGEIPSSFSTIYFLEHLNLSYNNLSGKIPTSGQLSTFDLWTYVGNKDLCGMPLPACPVYQTPFDARVEDDEKLEKLLEYTSIVVGFVVGFWLFIGTLIMKQAIKFAFFRWIDKTSDWIYVQFTIKLAKVKSKWQTMT